MDEYEKINPNRKEWAEFIDKCDNKNIFQTLYMKEVYEKTRDFEPVYIFLSNSEGEIVSGVLAYIRKKNMFSWSIIHGGPLFTDVDSLPHLLGEYDNEVKSKTLFTEIRNTSEIERNVKSIILNQGYKYSDHLTFILDLSLGKDKIWKGMSRSLRKNIKRAKKKGVEIREIEKKSEIDDFYMVLKSTYDRARIPLADVSLFRSAFDILKPKGMIKFDLAMLEDKCIGGRVTLLFNGKMYAWYMGILREYGKYYPAALLNWNLIEWGIENGYRYLDLGGAGKPGEYSGRYLFKRQFGGKEINFGRFKKIYSMKYKIAMMGFSLYRKIGI